MFSGTGTKRGSMSGTLTRANLVRPPCFTTTARFLLRFEMYGNGWPGSNASGVRTGKMSVRKKLARYSLIAGVKSATSRKWTPSAASSGRSDSFQQRDRLPIIVSARPRMAISCCSVFRPSGERSSMPARYFFSSVASRTMKNSSRLVPLMPRNLTRSSSGCALSHAWASTRWLNSSHESSRFR